MRFELYALNMKKYIHQICIKYERIKCPVRCLSVCPSICLSISSYVRLKSTEQILIKLYIKTLE